MSMTATGGLATRPHCGKKASAMTPSSSRSRGAVRSGHPGRRPGEGTGAARPARPLLVLTGSVVGLRRGLATPGAGLAAGAAVAAAGGAALGAVAGIARVRAGRVAGRGVVGGATAVAEAGAARALML